MAIVQRYIATRNDKCTALFISKWTRRISLKQYGRTIQHAREKASIDNASPYTLRHTFANEYVYNGGNLEALKGIMGHSDIKTTELYFHDNNYSDESRFIILSFILKILFFSS